MMSSISDTMSSFLSSAKPSWKVHLLDELEEKLFKRLCEFIDLVRIQTEVFPKSEDVFRAFSLTSFEDVKVVILGQDPYHNEGQAHGLSFSVESGIKIPPSLRNIYRELETDLNCTSLVIGDLTSWAEQGVLLLNSILTVEKNKPGSHQNIGWELFTDSVIKTLSCEREHLVFLLWGNYARAKKDLIDTKKHLVLEAAHPSPFSAYKGFFGCKHFSKTNEFLESKGFDPVSWH